MFNAQITGQGVQQKSPPPPLCLLWPWSTVNPRDLTCCSPLRGRRRAGRLRVRSTRRRGFDPLSQRQVGQGNAVNGEDEVAIVDSRCLIGQENVCECLACVYAQMKDAYIIARWHLIIWWTRRHVSTKQQKIVYRHTETNVEDSRAWQVSIN